MTRGEDWIPAGAGMTGEDWILAGIYPVHGEPFRVNPYTDLLAEQVLWQASTGRE